MTTTLTKPRRKKLGRPTAFTPATRRRLISCIAKGVPLTHAPSACGVSYSGFCDYRAAHPQFEEAIQRAVARAIEKNLNLIIAAAESGDANCAKWWLEKCHAKFFSRQAVEISGPDGSPLAAAVALYLPAKSDSEPRRVPTITTDAPHEN